MPAVAKENSTFFLIRSNTRLTSNHKGALIIRGIDPIYLSQIIGAWSHAYRNIDPRFLKILITAGIASRDYEFFKQALKRYVVYVLNLLVLWVWSTMPGPGNLENVG